MKDFNWTSFSKKIAIKSTLSAIYNAWTVPTDIEKWFLEKANFYTTEGTLTDSDQAISKGLSYEWFWYLYPEPMKGLIKEANGKNFIQFTFEGECMVDIKLKEQDEYIIIELTHYNIPTDDYSRQFVRLGCTNGWTFYLANLKSICEGGIDLRNKDKRLSPMINN